MAKCIFYKKHPTLKGYHKCQITGKFIKSECYFYNYSKKPCKYYEPSLINRFFKWLGF